MLQICPTRKPLQRNSRTHSKSQSLILHGNFRLELQAIPSYKNDKSLHFQRELFLVPFTFPAPSSPKRTHTSASTAMEVMEDRGTNLLLNAKEDRYGGVIVNVEEPMDSMVFASLLQSSMSSWREQGKKGVWIKLPIGHANLVETVVKAGFRYHHAESDYLMLVHWIPNTADTIPANASHRVGIGAFVINDNREVLVVQEHDGWSKGKDLWKLPTGTVEEGEDICDAAVREVKEETGIETEFVEVLAFRQSHKAFFQKSDVFFVCMLQPRSFDIQMQTSEIAAAQWMPFEEYAAQPFVKQTSGFDSVAKICLEKLNGNYTGFSPLPIITSSGKKTYLYFNKQHAGHLFASKDDQA